MVTNNFDWLATNQEPAFDADQKIIDPHHHLWDGREDGRLLRYFLDELLVDTADLNVRQTVFIECGAMYRAAGDEAMRPVGETEYVAGVSAQSASGMYGDMRACTGIVSHADLLLGSAVGEVLDAHMEMSTRFRGIRHHASWDPSPDVPNSRIVHEGHLYLNETYRAGFAELGKRNLSFEAWLYHPQIPELTDLARAFPETTIILNHLGGPLGVGPYAGRHDEIFPGWKDTITELATCDNVVAKVGGIQMVINGFGWHEQERAPSSDEMLAVNRRWYEHTIQSFGPDRCMFESNFPVDKASCSYTNMYNQFFKLVADYPQD
ncbi:MAG: amidohydrolase family protein, partial [Chloroflexi bacterium]|nr:amidohydrolase family protein [Chloroflexota bacterium]